MTELNRRSYSLRLHNPLELIYKSKILQEGDSLGVTEIAKMLVAQLCPTLCDSMDCSSPGSSVHGILQARILECVANPFSRGSS